MKNTLTMLATALLIAGCKTKCNDCSDCTPVAAPIVVDQNDFQSWTVDPKVHTNKIDKVIR